MNVRALSLSLLGVPIFLLCGCASMSGPDRPFTLIKPEEGWVPLKAPPEESPAIIASAGQSIQEMLENRKKYQVTWFARKTDDYLIYFQLRDPAATCGDEAPEFFKDEDGKWIEDRLGRISICKQ